MLESVLEGLGVLPSELRPVDRAFVRKLVWDFHFPPQVRDNKKIGTFWRCLGFVEEPLLPMDRRLLEKFRDHRQGDFLRREKVIFWLASAIGAVAVKRWEIPLQLAREPSPETKIQTVAEVQEDQQVFLVNAPTLCIKQIEWYSNEFMDFPEIAAELRIQWPQLLAFESEAHFNEYVVPGFSEYFDSKPKESVDFIGQAFLQRASRELGAVPNGWENAISKYLKNLYEKAPGFSAFLGKS